MNILFIYLYYRRMYTECCIKKCKIDNYQFLVKEKSFWERSSTYFLGSFLLRRRAIVSHQHIGLVLCLDSVAQPLTPHLLVIPQLSLTSFTENPFLHSGIFLPPQALVLSSDKVLLHGEIFPVDYMAGIYRKGNDFILSDCRNGGGYMRDNNYNT